MKIKICGLNITRDVQLCIDLKVNFLGFVFYKRSPRNINLKDIKNLSKFNKNNSSFVAVTVNPTDDFIKRNLLGNFDYIQLHGSETNKRIAEIKNPMINRSTNMINLNIYRMIVISLGTHGTLLSLNVIFMLVLKFEES